MAVFNLVVGADNLTPGILGFRLMEDEWDRPTADLYTYVETERLLARPDGEYVLGCNGFPLKRHRNLGDCFMKFRSRTSTQTSSALPYAVRRREITIDAPVHLLEPICLDPDYSSVRVPSLHAYPTSHYNTTLLPRLLPLLLAGNHTGLPPGFPVVLWDLCCSWLLDPLPLPGSSHRIDYDAWCADCVTSKSVVRICQDLGPNCRFTWRGKDAQRCSVCLGVAKALSNLNSRKRKKATANELASTALVPVSTSNPPSRSSSTSSSSVPSTFSLSDARGLILEAIQRTAVSAACSTVSALESRRIHGLTENTTQLSAGLIAVVIQLVQRAEMDRSFTSMKKLLAALGFLIQTFRRNGVDGRGPRAGDPLPTPAEHERIMKLSAVRQLNQRFAEFNILPVPGSPDLGCGILPDELWRMDDSFTTRCVNYQLDIDCSFMTTERDVYCLPCTAGCISCAGSHIDAALFLLHRRADYMLVLENDANLTGVQAKTLVRALEVISNDPVLKGSVALVLLHGGDASPCGVRASNEEVVADISGPGKKPVRAYLKKSSISAGSAGYVITAYGASLLIKSGFHRSLFCKDDFWNACNFYRRHDHFNPNIHNLPCVQHVLAAGGLRILRCTPDLVTLNKASSVSDTRYHVSD
jgi:hypothetical protein